MDDVALVRVDGYSGIGTLKREGAYFAVVEFNIPGHSWEAVVESGDYEVIGYVHTPHVILEEK